MSREILFRGQIKYNGNHLFAGEWVEGSLIIKTKGTFIYVIEEDEFGNVIREFEVEVKPETVSQLWIVNNVRLFGGDLFKATCSISGSNDKSTKICKVVDSDQGFSVSVWHSGEWWAYSFIDFTTIKLIGNIHDNQNFITNAN